MCSAFLNADASCLEECDSEAEGKPAENSEWVWTVLEGSEVVENPNGGTDGRPNVGCRWLCADGFTLSVLDAGQGTSVAMVAEGGSSVTPVLSFCVRNK